MNSQTQEVLLHALENKEFRKELKKLLAKEPVEYQRGLFELLTYHLPSINNLTHAVYRTFVDEVDFEILKEAFTFAKLGERLKKLVDANLYHLTNPTAGDKMKHLFLMLLTDYENELVEDFLAILLATFLQNEFYNEELEENERDMACKTMLKK